MQSTRETSKSATLNLAACVMGAALCSSPAGCALAPSMLEAGGEDTAETGGEDENCTGDDGNGDCSGQDVGCETTGEPDFADECLIGTEPDSLGTETSWWAPPCEVVCAEGWGHEGEQLPIEWTRLFPGPEEGLDGASLVAMESGEVRLLVSHLGGDTELIALDAATGQTQWTKALDLPPAKLVEAAAYGSRIYLLRRRVDETFEFRWVDLDGGEAFSSILAWGPDEEAALAVGPEGVGLIHHDDFELRDLDGGLLWQTAAPEGADAVAMGPPPGSRIAVGNDDGFAVYTPTGELLWSAPIEEQGSHGVSGLAFTTGNRVAAVGAVAELERFDGLLATYDQGVLDWRKLYNRALEWCPDPEDGPYEAETAEFFNDVAMLADGSLLIAAGENYEGGGLVGSQPWVGHVSAEGELLAWDRGLWSGYGFVAVAGPGGSALVLSTNEELDPDGLVVRQYSP